MTARSTVLTLLVTAVAIAGAVVVVIVGVRALDVVLALPPALASAVRRVGIVVAVLAAYRASSRWWEGRATPELAVSPAAIVAGALAGVGWVAVPLAFVYAAGGYHVVAVRGLTPALGGAFVVIWIAAFLEELVFRAVLFRVLEQRLGTAVALVVESSAFALAHVGNGDGGLLDQLSAAVASGVVGALWTLLYAWSRNVWVVTANHALWNFTIVLTGLTLSAVDDWRGTAPLDSSAAGPAWLVGGEFGPESSVVTLVWVCAWVVWMWRRVRAA